MINDMDLLKLVGNRREITSGHVKMARLQDEKEITKAIIAVLREEVQRMKYTENECLTATIGWGVEIK